MIDRNEPTFLIGPDGGLRRVPAYMVNDLQKQGWRLVINPKRQYYQEYDSTHPNYKKPEDQGEETDMVEVEII